MLFHKEYRKEVILKGKVDNLDRTKYDLQLFSLNESHSTRPK